MKRTPQPGEIFIGDIRAQLDWLWPPDGEQAYRVIYTDRVAFNIEWLVDKSRDFYLSNLMVEWLEEYQIWVFKKDWWVREDDNQENLEIAEAYRQKDHT